MNKEISCAWLTFYQEVNSSLPTGKHELLEQGEAARQRMLYEAGQCSHTLWVWISLLCIKPSGLKL